MALNHWEESDQIAWVVGGYFIGEAFQADTNNSDIIFGGVDQPAVILTVEARQRLWRWLDQKLRFGFSAINTKSLGSLMLLATLAEEEQLSKFANMMLHLHLFEIQSSFWSGDLIGAKIDEDSREDFRGLIWLLNGGGSRKSLKSPSSILYLICHRLGLELPNAFFDAGFIEKGLNNVGLMTTRFGASKNAVGSPSTANSEECMQYFGQDGLFCSLRCFVNAGNDYNLWSRHPEWKEKGNWVRNLQTAEKFDVYRVERIFEPFGGYRGEITAKTFMAKNHAVISVNLFPLSTTF